jgi:DNA-binding beta-propeller fold protein YncE
MKRFLALTALALVASANSFAAGSATNYTVLQRYVLGGSGKWDYLTLDSAAHRLYIARGNRVMVMDTQTGKLVGEVQGANGAHRVVILPDQHRGYVSNGHADSVMPFDLVSLKSLPAIAISGKDPDAMLYDKASARIWTFNGHSNSASLIDPTSAKETSSVALPGRPEFAVTDDAGHIYINLEDKSQIAQIDARSGKLMATWPLTPCEGPTGLAIDLTRRRLFSVCANQNLVVLDADNGHHVATLTIGDDPDAAGYDDATATVYSSNADGTLTVIHQTDADHYSVVANVVTAKNARTLAVDSTNHHVFLVAPDVSANGQATDQNGFGALVVGAH